MTALAARLRSYAVHLPAVRRWSGRGFWAVTDQALFAGTNFIVNILLARWLLPQEYGAFATAFAVFLLLATFHSALWAEPMMVFGPNRYRKSAWAYLRILMRAHWASSPVVLLWLMGVAWALSASGEDHLAAAFWGLAIAAPGLLALWFARRVCYVHLQPRIAAIASVFHLFLLLPLLNAIMKIGLNSPAIYFIAMGAVALLTAVAILSWIVRHSANIDVVHSADVLRDHWSFGRWGLIAGTLYWIPTSLPFIALPIANDVAASGYLKALMNVIMPAYQFNTAMAVLLLPALATTTRSSEHLRLLAVFALVLCLTSIGYASVIIGYGEEIFAIIYGGIYVARPMDIWLLSLLPLAHTADSLFDASLRAMMRPGLIAFGRALAAAVALTLGIALIFAYGTRGAIAAIVSAQLFFSLSIAIIWYRAFASETVNKTSSIEHDAKAIET